MSRKVVTQEMAIEFVSWLETLFFVTEDGPAVSIEFMAGLRQYTKQFGSKPRSTSFWFTRRCTLAGKPKVGWVHPFGFWHWDGRIVSFHPNSSVDRHHRFSISIMADGGKDEETGRDLICESRLWYWSKWFPVLDFGRLFITSKGRVADDGTQGGC